MKPLFLVGLACVSSILACSGLAQPKPSGPVRIAEWRAKAEQGDADSQAALGDAYLHGDGVTKDAAQGLKWLRKAADQRHPEAQAALGGAYSEGKGVTKDDVEAVRWYRLAADQNHAAAQHNLGGHYFEGHGVKRDPAEALRWFRKAAEQNLAESQGMLGIAHAEGLGVAKDLVEAYAWFSLAARSDKDAQKARSDLAKILAPADLAKAKARAHELGNQTAKTANDWQRELAMKRAELSIYQLQKSRNPDFAAKAGEHERRCEKARLELLPKAERGEALAQYHLGEHYSTSAPPSMKNDPEAVRWFRKAAEQDHKDALYILGYFHEKGYGVARDWEESVKWHRRAAELGHAGSQFALGRNLRDGTGTAKNPVEAYAWFELSGKSRTQFRDALGATLSPEQLGAGKKRAEELRTQIEAKLKSRGK